MKQTFRQATNPASKRGSSFQGATRLADLVYGPWAIGREQLTELQAIYETHLRGDKIDLQAVEARLGRPLANEQRSYELVSGVAVLPIEGVMAPKANLFMRISGGSSTQMIASQVSAAAEDSGVRSILLVIDSPGGSVLGTPELGQAIRDAAGVKPVVAICDGVIASAAYWAGSSANAVYITGPTVMAGSIGVVATHVDSSVADAKTGLKKTEITAGKYKRVDSGLEPLSEEGRAAMQEKVDYLYSLFVNVVAENRGVDVEAVLEHMADGRVFIGQQAIDAGLVDGVSSVDALIEQMATNPAAFSARRKAVVKAAGTPRQSKGAGDAQTDLPSSTTETGDPMTGETKPTITRASLETDHPTLFAALRTEFAAVGATAERDRIVGVRKQALPGHEALVEQLAMDGKTTPAEAAMAVNEAQRAATASAAAAHRADAPAIVKPGAAPEDKPGKTKAEMTAEAEKYAAENKVSFVEAFKKLGFKA